MLATKSAWTTEDFIQLPVTSTLWYLRCLRVSGQSHGTGLYISPVEKCRCSEPEAVQDAEGFGASQMAGDVYVWLTKSSTKV